MTGSADKMNRRRLMGMANGARSAEVTEGCAPVAKEPQMPEV